MLYMQLKSKIHLEIPTFSSSLKRFFFPTKIFVLEHFYDGTIFLCEICFLLMLHHRNQFILLKEKLF
jgi:hypothetical protein